MAAIASTRWAFRSLPQHSTLWCRKTAERPAGESAPYDDQRINRRPAPPPRRRRNLLDHPGAQLFAFPQRHDAVAGAGAVSDAEGHLWPQLRTGRIDRGDDDDDLGSVAARCRALCGLSATVLFAFGRHGGDIDRVVAASECRQFSNAAVRRGSGWHLLGPGPSPRPPP